MKGPVLLSVAGMACALIGTAQAGYIIPQPSTTHENCMAWAENQSDPALTEVFQQFCTDRKACNQDNSNNYETWSECDLRAKNKLNAALGGITQVSSSGGSGNTSPAVTEVADSEYDNPEREKGFGYSKGE